MEEDKMKKLKIILLFSLSFNLLFVISAGAFAYKNGYFSGHFAKADEKFPSMYKQRISIFNESKSKNVDVVFLGDSITDFGTWEEYFPDIKVLNRGISSDNTLRVLNRLDNVIEINPKKIFIMVGVNDDLVNRELAISNYKKITKTLKKSLPDTEIYIQSILPVNNEKFGYYINNSDVKEVNKEIEKIAANLNVNYIDLYSRLSKDNQLDSKYTIDGIHLNGKAYEVWVQEISNYVYR